MNKTLLLILCDFLLLNLLAFTSWERIEAPVSEVSQLPEQDDVEGQDGNEALLEAMKLAMEDERRARAELDAALKEASKEIDVREGSLEKLQDEKERLERELVQAREQGMELQGALQERTEESRQTRKALEDTQSKLAQTARAAELEKARLQKEREEALLEQARVHEKQRQSLQLAMEEQRRLMSANEMALAALKEAQQLTEAEKEKARQEAMRLEQERKALASSLQDAEKKALQMEAAAREAKAQSGILRESLDRMEMEVATVRKEKEAMREQTGVLMAGVSKLAESSGELSREIRENRAISPNQLFQEFLTNRVVLDLTWQKGGLFGDSIRNEKISALLVRDPRRGDALVFHLEGLPIRPGVPGGGGVRGWNLQTRGVHGDLISFSGVRFLAPDPRVMILPLTPEASAALGHLPLEPAADPFKFPKVILIHPGGDYYGETTFKLDPNHPGYVRLPNKLINRLFGEFSPRAGDLLLSQNGRWIGCMVNHEFAILVPELQTDASWSLPEGESAIREAVKGLENRLNGLSSELR